MHNWCVVWGLVVGRVVVKGVAVVGVVVGGVLVEDVVVGGVVVGSVAGVGVEAYPESFRSISLSSVELHMRDSGIIC